MAFKGRRGRPLIYGHSFGNASAEQALGDLAAGLRAIAGAPERMAQDVVDELRKLNEATIAAGTDAYGEPWKLNQDGSVPLRGAAKALTFDVVGAQVVVGLQGIEVAHHIGFARGYKGGTALRRPIIPERAGGKGRQKGIPEPWREVLVRVAGDVIGIPTD